MGRLVWFGVIALSPVGAVSAVVAVALLGVAAGYAVSQSLSKKEEQKGS